MHTTYISMFPFRRYLPSILLTSHGFDPHMWVEFVVGFLLAQIFLQVLGELGHFILGSYALYTAS